MATKKKTAKKAGKKTKAGSRIVEAAKRMQADIRAVVEPQHVSIPVTVVNAEKAFGPGAYAVRQPDPPKLNLDPKKLDRAIATERELAQKNNPLGVERERKVTQKLREVVADSTRSADIIGDTIASIMAKPLSKEYSRPANNLFVKNREAYDRDTEIIKKVQDIGLTMDDLLDPTKPADPAVDLDLLLRLNAMLYPEIQNRLMGPDSATNRVEATRAVLVTLRELVKNMEAFAAPIKKS